MFERTTETSRLDDAALSGEYGDELESPDGGWDAGGGGRRRAGRLLRALAVRLAWIGAAVVIALGSAGIVMATQHFPTSGGREELTWGADQALQPKLDAALSQLRSLSTDVDGLGDMARQARSALTQRDQVKLDAATRTGAAQIKAIDDRAATVRSSLGCQNDGVIAQLELSNSRAVIDLFNRACGAIDATGSLGEDWNSLISGAGDAMQVTNLIVDHDRVAGKAVELGSTGKYADAITQLNAAVADLKQITPRYNDLLKITDVWTLGQWLERSQAMDDALRQLWTAMIASKGRQATPEVKAALQAVEQAKAALPPDTQYMSVVLAELATAGVNQAAISIETARGQLTSAVAGLTQLSGS